MAHGTVTFFKPDKGWGAVTSPDLPDGFDAWVHFSAIEMDGFRSLNAGDSVEFDYEPAGQDSSCFDATRARKLQQTRFTRRAGKPAPSPVCRHPAAYAGPPRGGRCVRGRGRSALMAAWPG